MKSRSQFRGVFEYMMLPSTTKTILSVGYLEFLYEALQQEPTNMMVMVVSGFARLGTWDQNIGTCSTSNSSMTGTGAVCPMGCEFQQLLCGLKFRSSSLGLFVPAVNYMC